MWKIVQLFHFMLSMNQLLGDPNCEAAFIYRQQRMQVVHKERIISGQRFTRV